MGFASAATTLYSFDGINNDVETQLESEWTAVGSNPVTSFVVYNTTAFATPATIVSTGSNQVNMGSVSLGTEDYSDPANSILKVDFTITGNNNAVGAARYWGLTISDGSNSVTQWYAADDTAYDIWVDSTNLNKFDSLEKFYEGELTSNTFTDVTYVLDTKTSTLDTTQELTLSLTAGNFVGGATTNTSAAFSLGRLTVQQVPEPSSLVLVGLGGLALLARRRR